MNNVAKQFEAADDADLELANILSAKWGEEDADVIEDADEVIASEAFDEDAALVDVVDDLEIAEELAEAQNEQAEASIAADASAAAPSTDSGKTKTKRVRATTEGMKPSEIVRTKVPEYADALIARPEWATMDEAGRHAQVNALVDSFDAMPKKIGEKAVNLTQALVSANGLSVYTKIAVDFLAEKGTVTLKELIAHFETGNRRPYSHGTASAQSSQMMQLLPAVGIATREGSTLTYVADSPIGEWVLNANSLVQAEAA